MTRSNPPPAVVAPVSERFDSAFADGTPDGERSASPLAVAYAAYRRTAPSEREVSLGVARVRARLHARRRRFRTGALLAFTVVFAGALAYAAGALGVRPFSSVSNTSAPASERPLGARPERSPAASAPAASAAALPPVVARELPSGAAPAAPSISASPPGSASHASSNAVEPTRTRAARSSAAHPSPLGARSARPARDRTSSAAWAVVAESMAADDHARAEGALRELARSESSDTRNNARLGLAQLALGRGDCAEARRLAQRVLQGTPSAYARRRGEEVLARCAQR